MLTKQGGTQTFGGGSQCLLTFSVTRAFQADRWLVTCTQISMHMDEAWVGACVRAHTYTHTLAHSNKCKHTSAKGLEFGTNSATNLCDLEQGTKPFCPSVALFVKWSLACFLKSLGSWGTKSNSLKEAWDCSPFPSPSLQP